MEHEIPWPPAYIVKPHPRARHVKLKASLKHGLELVVPRRFNQKHIPSILEEHRAWIEKQFIKIAAQRQSDTSTLPTKIILSAINQTWEVYYIASNLKSKLKIISRPHQELVLMGDIENQSLCKKALLKWVKNQAKVHLLSKLQELSHQTKLSYKKAVIRGQESRWGSCSGEKSISLNFKLLFLPAHLAAHIMIHELCHTVHLNHSTAFWRLVASFDPQWKENNRKMREAADMQIPAWAG